MFLSPQEGLLHQLQEDLQLCARARLLLRGGFEIIQCSCLFFSHFNILFTLSFIFLFCDKSSAQCLGSSAPGGSSAGNNINNLSNNSPSLPPSSSSNVPRQRCSSEPERVARQECRNVPQQQCQTLPQQDCVSVPNQSCLNPSLACSSQPREGAIFGKISQTASNSQLSMAISFSPNIDQTVPRQECRNVCNNIFWCKVGPIPAPGQSQVNTCFNILIFQVCTN